MPETDLRHLDPDDPNWAWCWSCEEEYETNEHDDLGLCSICKRGVEDPYDEWRDVTDEVG